jgi:hypothetical protein
MFSGDKSLRDTDTSLRVAVENGDAGLLTVLLKAGADSKKMIL